MGYVADNEASTIILSLEHPLITYLEHELKFWETMGTIAHQKSASSCSSWGMSVQMPAVVLGLQTNNFLEFWTSLPKPSGREGEDAQIKAAGFY